MLGTESAAKGFIFNVGHCASRQIKLETEGAFYCASKVRPDNKLGN
jgi:hypothetical protein